MAPTSGLLAWRCANTAADIDDLLWLTALGVIGDFGEMASFEELAYAKGLYSATTLRKSTSLVNAPSCPAPEMRPAFRTPDDGCPPRGNYVRRLSETALLRRVREEVDMAHQVARLISPKIKNGVALIVLDSPCQLHSLTAQEWRGLKNNIVIAADRGYRPGWVHFSERSVSINLLGFRPDVAHAGADKNYGSGHEQATGRGFGHTRGPSSSAHSAFGTEMGVAE